MAQCPQCNGTGKVQTEKPTSSTTIDIVEEPCSFCEGTGQVYEDFTPAIVERLDKIILQNNEIIQLLKILRR